jgi:hypothetical protein
VPFGERVDRKLHFGVKTPQKTPELGTGMPNFQPNKYTGTKIRKSVYSIMFSLADIR